MIITLILLSPLLMLVSCETSADETAGCAYDLFVTVDAAENIVKVDQKVSVKNNFRDGLDRLVFAFYPDAFTLKSPPPVDQAMISATYPYGINAGGYTFLEAGGENVKNVEICKTPCKITVYLESPLALGDSAEIVFSFDLTLPLCNARYGYNDFSVNLTFFFPQLCRYDKEKGDFEFYGYESTGDPFVFDTADYALTLQCPSEWSVACSAPFTSEKEGKRTYYGSRLRDLSLFLALEAVTTTAEKNGYTATVLHDGNFGYAAEYAAKALAVFSKAFCELSVKQYFLIFTPFMTAGAEFSNAAVISSSLSFAEIEKTVVHEVAHQWWYNLVGSDQVKSPWQDEALAQWSAWLYFVKTDMKEYAKTMMNGLSSSYADYVATQRSLGEAALCDVFRSTSDYRDFTDYYITVYCKAALAVSLTADSTGVDGFCEALSAYAKEYSLSFAPKDALFASLDKYSEGLGKMLKSSLSATLY